jgi:ribonuclease BN (tRNA processing enzyme)
MTQSMLKSAILIALALVLSFFPSGAVSRAQSKATPTTQVVFLGTGSPRPSTDRFGPATAIVAGDRAFLVDFGPGVVRRAAAAAQRNPALEPTKITTAFVTHLHSDHTVGYPDLIFTPWVMGRTELTVYGPEGTEEMTKHVLEAWRRDIEIRTQGLEHRGAMVVHAHDVAAGVAYKDDNVTVTAFRVPHGQWPQAFGYRFDTPGRSIVISGDTSPSEELIAHCQPCDVLIHEGYSPSAKVPMPDWPAYSARYHTSTKQLAEIANRAKPGLLVIYHVSGRTPDDQLLAEVQETYHGKVVIAHDLDVY